MKYFFSFLALLFSFLFNAQTLQLYFGVFETGKATYTYYENEKSDRLYQGKFSYTGNPYTVNGSFLENKRVGLWKITALNKVYKNEKSRIQLNTNINGKFKESHFDSTWSYSNTIKTYNPKTKKFSPKGEKVNGKATFKNNLFIGKLNVEMGTTNKTIFSGQFTDLSVVDGIWTKKTAKEIEEWKFKNGVLVSHLIKNITTGDKLLNDDQEAFYDQIWANFNAAKNIAYVGDKMYFLDTIEFQHEALNIWQLDVLSINGFGSYINPLHFYERGLNRPSAKQLVFIECAGGTDCFNEYMKQKNADIEAQKQKEIEEAEQLRLEALAKEEQARIEKEKELERQRIEQLANAERIGDELVNQKKYRAAINQFVELNKMNYSDRVTQKINRCEQAIAEIDSLHHDLKNKYIHLKNQVDPAFQNAYSIEPKVKAKKKVYGTNYVLCINYLKDNFMPSFNAFTVDQQGEDLEVWNQKDEKLAAEISIMTKQLEEVTAFYTLVNEAVSKNDKAKLRVLNSSLNPKTIIHDFINYKLN